MRFSTVAIAALAATSASAFSVSKRQNGFPNCAVPCLMGTGYNGTCALTDNTCLCKDPAYTNLTTACIANACPNPSDLQEADGTAVALCKAAGVDLTSSTAPSTASATGSPSSAASAAAASQTKSAAGLQAVADKKTLVGGLAAVAAVLAFAL